MRRSYAEMIAAALLRNRLRRKMAPTIKAFHSPGGIS
jgi:hypothetical protein